MSDVMNEEELTAADEALPAKEGLTQDEAQDLERFMREGAGWDAAVEALKAGRHGKLVPSEATLAGWRDTLTARVNG